MTKKDHIVLAAALNMARSRTYYMPERRAILIAAEHIADALQADNPNFDHEKFFAAVLGDTNVD